MAQTNLLYSIRFRTILYLLGYPILAVGLATCVPLAVSFYHREFWLSMPYAGCTVFSLGLGWGLVSLKAVKKIQFNEAVAVVCGIYLYASLLATIPLIFGGFSFMDALFEAVSGITTTGLTVIADWDRIPKTTFFVRSWLQWIGGLGIMLFSLAFIIGQGEITKKISNVESNPRDIIAGSKSHAKGIITIYSGLTVFGVLALALLGVSLYDSILLIFASVSTGGFSPFRDSIASLSLIQQAVILFFCLTCSVSFPFYYKLWKKGFRLSLQGIQIIGILALASALSLTIGGTFEAFILGFSSQTTAGFSTFSPSSLSDSNKLLTIFSMLIGGGIGSTAGGFKVLRLFLFFACLKTLIIEQCQTKHAVYKPRFFGLSLSPVQFHRAMIMISLFVFITSLSWLCFLACGYSPLDSLFDVASAVGTVGLSCGVVKESMPAFLKGILCIDMLLGRLEIIPWMMMIYPKTWIGQKLGSSSN